MKDIFLLSKFLLYPILLGCYEIFLYLHLCGLTPYRLLKIRSPLVSTSHQLLPIVMVEEAPTSFSPFSLVNCTLLSHFSFNDFITVTFPDLARDLNNQI